MYIKQKEIKWDKQLTFQELRLHFLTLQRRGKWNVGSIWRPGFSKKVYSKERVKPLFFMTFNIIKNHIFSENFIEIPQVVQKI